ncbi:MAG TPA: 2-phosphosulfolactate phosphatase [candidate division Zixibacteria bacterium]|jgi:2-phosphosulfolactate phosphatase
MHIAVSLAPAARRADCLLMGDALGAYVVIDILRASAVICTALANGAASVIPVDDVEPAREKREEPGLSDALLCGERGGHKLPGFDLGNSPSEYTRKVIGGKTLIHASTNGSPALQNAPQKAVVMVGGLVNLTAVAEQIVALNRPTMLVCAGKNDRVALEDAVGAGAIIAKLWELIESVELVNDGATIAQSLWDQYKSEPVSAMWQSEHGRYLISVGYGADLSVCAAIDSVPVVPVMRNGALGPK